MFESKEDVQEGPGTVVGANVKLTGTLKDVNDITVHGQVNGDVVSDQNVFIAETAKIKGPVKAKTITIAGEVHGEVEASARLEILESGKIKGSVSTDDLVIKSGAIINGKCEMKKGAEDMKDEKGVTKKAIKTDIPKTRKEDLAKMNKSGKYELE